MAAELLPRILSLGKVDILNTGGGFLTEDVTEEAMSIETLSINIGNTIKRKKVGHNNMLKALRDVAVNAFSLVLIIVFRGF